jgi:hypothetical protein
MSRRLTRATVLLLVALLPLLLAEIAVRGLVAQGRLGLAPSHDAALDWSLDRLRESGPPDVLLLGDSLTAMGIEPAVLGTLASDALGWPVRVFGAAQLGTDVAVSDVLAEQLQREGIAPSAVVIGLSLGSLEGPTGPPPLLASRYGQYLSGCRSSPDPVATVDCLLGQASVLWRWRGQPERVVQAATGSAPREWVDGPRTRRLDGFLAEGGRTAEWLAAQVRPTVRRRTLDAHLDAQVTGQLAGLVGRLRSAGSSVVVVFLPYSPPLMDALAARDPAFDVTLDASLDALGAAAGTTIVDPGRFGDWWTPAASSDVRHLSTDGAAAFTRQLWAMPGFRDPLIGALRDDDG